MDHARMLDLSAFAQVAPADDIQAFDQVFGEIAAGGHVGAGRTRSGARMAVVSKESCGLT